MRAIDADAFVRKIRKQYCEDCARRKGIKNGKMQYLYEIGGVPCRACEIEDMLNEVEDAPTIQPEPHWIPVTEDTPTEDGDYWCTLEAETGRFADWCSWYKGQWVVWIRELSYPVSNVVAWCKPMETYEG